MTGEPVGGAGRPAAARAASDRRVDKVPMSPARRSFHRREAKKGVEKEKDGWKVRWELRKKG